MQRHASEGTVENDDPLCPEEFSKRVEMLISGPESVCGGQTWTQKSMHYCLKHFTLSKSLEGDDIKSQRKKPGRSTIESDGKEDKLSEDARKDHNDSPYLIDFYDGK